jgi:hypothetical protein
LNVSFKLLTKCLVEHRISSTIQDYTSHARLLHQSFVHHAYFRGEYDSSLQHAMHHPHSVFCQATVAFRRLLISLSSFVSVLSFFSVLCFASILCTPDAIFAQEAFLPPAEKPRIHALSLVALSSTASVPAAPITIDGVLNEPAWQQASVIQNFTQQNPVQGAAPSHPTEVRIVFDQDYLYISAVCHDSINRDGIRVQNLRRDFAFDQNDLFCVNIDGFLDTRNAWSFAVTPLGAQRDAHVVDEYIENLDWDALWYVKTRIENTGWTAEFAIPWKTIRYPEGCTQIGVTFTRSIRKNNEFVTFPAIPRAYSAFRMVYEAALTGITPPPPSTSLLVNPYLLLEGLRDVRGNRENTALVPKLGGEIKWAITPNSVLDITVNTDFAQADVDRQVVNLSRFSVLFPERRQFFLENASLFYTGFDNIQPFFSRSIGLDGAGSPVPLDGGLRFVSQTPEQSIGAIVMRQRGTASDPLSHFAVGRYSKNFGQSYIGGLVTARQDDAFTDADGTLNTANFNGTLTLDGQFRPSQLWGVQGMVSVSRDGRDGTGLAAGLWSGFTDTWGYAGIVAQYVSPTYNPRAGFVGLNNYININPGFDFDIRPSWLPSFVRSYAPDGDVDMFWQANGRFIQGDAQAAIVRFRLQDGGNAEYRPQIVLQQIDNSEDFKPLGIELSPGFYRYWRHRFRIGTDYSQPIAGTLRYNTGGYFNGSLNVISAELRAAPIPQIETTITYEFNQIRGVGKENVNKDTHLLTANLRLALNPFVQLVGLYQYNTAAERGGLNLRFSWEYEPRSFLFVVFNDNRSLPTLDRMASTTPFVRQDGIIKLTYVRQL